jgi:resuscitation-promoting factor RpfA
LCSSPQHSAARQRHPLRNRIVGLTFVASATLITGISLTPTASAAGSVWDSVAACESGSNWAINTGNGFLGGLQFTVATWAAYGGTRYAASANQASRGAQIAIAQRVLAGQGPGAWPVCGRRAGLTRANGVAAPSSVTVSRSLARVAIAAHATLTVDGRIGPNTIRAIQHWVAAPQTRSFGSATIRALQRKVGASADGVIGPNTVRSLQVKIGVRRHGARYLDVATVAALQRCLNAH